MSEQDRGAYAPFSEAPLAFDPRRDGARRGPAPLTLIVSVLVLMALAAGVMLLYRHGARHHGEAPQIVGAPVGDTKTAPPAGSDSSTDETAGLQVYKTEAVPTAEQPPAPAFAPAPEQPQARPVTAPPPAPVATIPLRAAEPAPSAPPPMVKPVIVAKPLPAPKPVVAAAKPSAAVAIAARPAAKSTIAAAAPVAKKPPKPVKVAAVEDTAAASAFAAASGDTSIAAPRASAPAKPKALAAKAAAKPTAPKSSGATTAATAAAGGPATVQIGAFSSAELAQSEDGKAMAAAGGKGAGKSRKVETTTKDGKTFYRGLIGGFASRADAAAFCSALRASGKTCFVK